MTDHLDELASAYLDGEATEAEIARVENDPAILARVDELAAMASALDVDLTPRDPSLRDRHIDAALEAFSQLGAPSTGDRDAAVVDLASVVQPEETPGRSEGGVNQTADGVVDLSVRREARRPSGSRQDGRRSGLPSWLGAAAVVMAVVGGIGVVSQLGGGDDDAETAAVSADTEDAVDVEQSTDFDAADGALADDEAMAAEVEESEDAADDSAAGSSAADAPDAAETPAVESASPTTPSAADADDGEAAEESTGGFFPEESIDQARVPLDGVPTADELLALADEADPLDPALSTCAPDGLFDDRLIEGFVPVDIDGQEGEALYAVVDGTVVPILVTSDCLLWLEG